MSDVMRQEAGSGPVREFETEDMNLYLLDDHVVLVETKPGVTLDKTKTKRFYDLIETQLPGDYSLIINRKNDYRLMRVEVYGVANTHSRLRGVAIVVHRKLAGAMAEIEAPLCQKQFAKFANVDDAVAWARSLHR